jgi:hypothetical protein
MNVRITSVLPCKDVRAATRAWMEATTPLQMKPYIRRPVMRKGQRKCAACSEPVVAERAPLVPLLVTTV